MKDKITVEAQINAPTEKVWDAYNDPEQVKQWNSPSSDWHTPKAENDLKVGGKFNYRMEAKDGSAGFDFAGEYTAVDPHKFISYKMDDGREVETTFTSEGSGVKVTTKFDPETENPPEFQQAGWQSILDNFKGYVERLA